MTYKELLQVQLQKVKEEYQAEVQLLLLAYCQGLGIDLYANYQETVDQEMIALLETGVQRLNKDEPLGYILGYQPFYGYDIMVDQRALIPRPETEELVNEILMLLDEKDKGRILQGLDLGTGSGAIAITLCLENPQLEMLASDISEQALSLAKENAEKFACDIAFIQSDLFQNITPTKQFDFIVCNPPYIKNQEKVEASVYNYEPHQALFGGPEGLDFYQLVLAQAPDYLAEESLLAFEIGYDQGPALQALAQAHFPDSEVIIKQDINAKDRILLVLTNWH